MSRKPSETSIQKLSAAFVDNPCDKTFQPLMMRMKWGLRGHIYKIVQDNEAVDDIYIKTFEDIWSKLDQFDKTRGQFSSWAYGIARNNSLLYLQEKKAHRNRHISIDVSELYDSSLRSESDDLSIGRPSNNSMDSVSYIEDVDCMVDDNGKFITINKDTLIDDLADASIKCIDYLPDNYKLVLKEQLVNKKKINQIAEDNKIPMTTIVNWLYKGKLKLQEVVKERYKNLYETYRSYYPG